MARTASVALAGYYPTPEHLLPRIAALLEPLVQPSTHHHEQREAALLDPCAGEGAAASFLSTAWGTTATFACELEAGRFEKARHALSYQNTIHGDAFRAQYVKRGEGISVLFLNPPYDTDRVHGRLEEKFLARFTPALMDSGVLVYVVPEYALAASANTLAMEYESVRVFRFPEADYAAYKQVVLVARKVPTRLEPLTQAFTVQDLPKDARGSLGQVPSVSYYRGGFSSWTMLAVDTTALLAKLRPWCQTLRGGTLAAVPNILPELPVQDLLLRTYPVATPPRPAHIAAGIASGLFNGAQIDSPGRPSLLVKGVFDREYKTVEQKTNKDGMVKGEVQVQQPKLVVTVLDLDDRRYKTLDAEGVGKLLEHYGDSMMGVMQRQCPVLYDPRRDAASVTLPASPRKLYAAQAHAAKALVKLLEKRNVSVLLGEIGAGKTTVAMSVAETRKARRILVVCPPHLLRGWENEITSTVPDAKVVTLTSVSDLADLEESPYRTVVALLSREAAKLGHAWASVPKHCPRCGAAVPAGDLAKKRARCEHTSLTTDDVLGSAIQTLALRLAPYADTTPVLRGRFDQERHAILAARKTKPAFRWTMNLAGVIAELVERSHTEQSERLTLALATALLLADDHEITLRAIVRLAKKKPRETIPVKDGDPETMDGYERSDSGSYWYPIQAEDEGYDNGLASGLALMLPPRDPRQAALAETYAWSDFDEKVKATEKSDAGSYRTRVGPCFVSWKTGKLELDGHARGSLSAALNLLQTLTALATYTRGEPCGEFLYQAIPEPRRVALSKHINRYHRDLFDFVVIDECHEASSDESAQGRSAHRLMNMGAPTLLMTGTIMNGYAESMFANLWYASPAFRAEFGLAEKQKFIDRYGYRKRVVEDRDEEGTVVEFGSQSDRVTRSERVIGNAPGILPLFLLRHLLPISVTLHKSDLAIDLPACTQEKKAVDPGPELLSNYKILQAKLVAAIRRDQFVPDRAGRLFGQLAELPSYLDRAASGDYEIRYPESLKFELVARQESLPEGTVLPKEAWILDQVETELAAGRNVMVFSWHVALLPRIAKLVSDHIGEPVPILHADKVPTAKRQDWIDREVVKKKRRVLVANPVSIQTGLNNLVHFATEIWHENPACNPLTYRQTVGRVDRIGQKRPTRILFPIYQDTLQVQLYELLMQKVAVSTATDGLDPESALLAAGVGDASLLQGMSIGKALWRLMNEEAA